jgi:hypothetical protein
MPEARTSSRRQDEIRRPPVEESRAMLAGTKADSELLYEEQPSST